MKLIPQEIVDEAAEDVYNIRMELDGSPLSYDTEHVALLEKQLFKAGTAFAESEIIERLQLLIKSNEDDFDRGKGKYILQQFINGEI